MCRVIVQNSNKVFGNRITKKKCRPCVASVRNSFALWQIPVQLRTPSTRGQPLLAVKQMLAGVDLLHICDAAMCNRVFARMSRKRAMDQNPENPY